MVHPQKKIDLKYRSYYFALTTIRQLNRLKLPPAANPLIVQLIRSSSSIGANVVEGRSGSSKKDLARFYQIALKSANETKYWLCLLRDVYDLKENKIDSLIREADEIARILASSILTLHRQIKSEK
jgi:four helix bundle protein